MKYHFERSKKKAEEHACEFDELTLHTGQIEVQVKGWKNGGKDERSMQEVSRTNCALMLEILYQTLSLSNYTNHEVSIK